MTRKFHFKRSAHLEIFIDDSSEQEKTKTNKKIHSTKTTVVKFSVNSHSIDFKNFGLTIPYNNNTKKLDSCQIS